MRRGAPRLAAEPLEACSVADGGESVGSSRCLDMR